ncbi:MAG TPA: hypothetical protein DDZ81_05715 [Acetobacteraceae bacterium]|nr:hypothetical protein [Acetobacteraceae bacterium]
MARAHDTTIVHSIGHRGNRASGLLVIPPTRALQGAASALAPVAADGTRMLDSIINRRTVEHAAVMDQRLPQRLWPFVRRFFGR